MDALIQEQKDWWFLENSACDGHVVDTPVQEQKDWWFLESSAFDGHVVDASAQEQKDWHFHSASAAGNAAQGNDGPAQYTHLSLGPPKARVHS